jgi:hypothetical protein
VLSLPQVTSEYFSTPLLLLLLLLLGWGISFLCWSLVGASPVVCSVCGVCHVPGVWVVITVPWFGFGFFVVTTGAGKGVRLISGIFYCKTIDYHNIIKHNKVQEYLGVSVCRQSSVEWYCFV